MRRFSWLAYSQQQDGCFCRYCVLLVAEAGVGTNNQRPGHLVVIKHDRWKDALENFASHQLSIETEECCAESKQTCEENMP